MFFVNIQKNVTSICKRDAVAPILFYHLSLKSELSVAFLQPTLFIIITSFPFYYTNIQSHHFKLLPGKCLNTFKVHLHLNIKANPKCLFSYILIWLTCHPLFKEAVAFTSPSPHCSLQGENLTFLSRFRSEVHMYIYFEKNKHHTRAQPFSKGT